VAGHALSYALVIRVDDCWKVTNINFDSSVKMFLAEQKIRLFFAVAMNSHS
jgi:hypothetical protein